MPVALISVSFVSALLCATTMGYAIQSGATCTVYAVAELIESGRATRLVAMVEAGLWVALILTAAALLNWSGTVPPAYPIAVSTVGGGILLGLGATLNGACVFGSVARFGAGELAFAATPLGYLAGVLGYDRLLGHGGGHHIAAAASVSHIPAALLLLFGGYAGYRSLRTIYWTVQRERAEQRPHLWDPHEATLVIGVTFAILMLAVGAWTYPELLADLARGQFTNTSWRVTLFFALLAGARLAGHRHGRRAWISPRARQLTARFCGGALMGLGGATIPGGNDGLVLVGLPFLQPFALLALTSMALTIALVLWFQHSRPAIS